MRRVITIFIITCIASLSSLQGFSQNENDREFVSQLSLKTEHIHKFEFVGFDQSGARMIATNLFVLYKRYVSSQDGMSCGFTPSCSQYAFNSIQQLGFLKGLLNALDRITRCHSFNQNEYPLIGNLKLDPVCPTHGKH